MSVPIQYHFVVYGTVDDDGNVTFMVDDDTAVAQFSDGCLYDDESGEWREATTPEEESTDAMIGFVLRNLVQGEHRE